MTEEETEKFGSMMITWTGLSFLIGGIMLGFEIEHNKHKKAKKVERQHDSHHLTMHLVHMRISTKTKIRFRV